MCNEGYGGRDCGETSEERKERLDATKNAVKGLKEKAKDEGYGSLSENKELLGSILADRGEDGSGDF